MTRSRRAGPGEISATGGPTELSANGDPTEHSATGGPNEHSATGGPSDSDGLLCSAPPAADPAGTAGHVAETEELLLAATLFGADGRETRGASGLSKPMRAVLT